MNYPHSSSYLESPVVNIITAVCGESCWLPRDEHWASRELRKAERKKQRFLQSSALQWQFSKALLRDSGVCKQLQLPRPHQKSSYLWLVSEGSTSLGKPRGSYSGTLKRPMMSNGDFKPLTTKTVLYRRADPGNQSYNGPLAGGHVDIDGSREETTMLTCNASASGWSCCTGWCFVTAMLNWR